MKPGGIRITRLDILTLWGRALAHTVGYTAEIARPLGVAWAYRRTDPRNRQPPEGLAFGGYVFERFEAADGQLGFTSHGAVRWPGDYEAAKARIGPSHDELLALAMEALQRYSITKLDGTKLGAELLHRRLLGAGIDAARFHRIGAATLLQAMRSPDRISGRGAAVDH